MSTIIPRYTDRLVNTSNFWLEVSRGSYDDMYMILKFGTNPDCATGVWELIANLSATAPYPFPTTPTTVRIKAGGNAADASGGAGARTLRIVGIDENLNEVTEDLTFNADGTLASASTTTTFWRVYRAYILTTGTYGGDNTGAVVIENTAGTADLLRIEAGGGQTRLLSFSVPLGWTAYFMGFEVHVDSTKPADIRVRHRENFNQTSAPYSPIREIFFEAGIAGGSQNLANAPLGIIPALSDIWIEARGAGANTVVSGAMEILMVKDEDTTVTTVS